MPPRDIVMSCPFCGYALTESHRLDTGRYSCPQCAPALAEAKYGWIPRHSQAAVSQPLDAGGLTRLSIGDRMFARDDNGAMITRESTCECGNQFRQTLLSERFLSIVERQGGRALALMTKEVPGFFVPVHCPPCERKDVLYSGRIAEARAPSASQKDWTDEL